MSASSEQSTEKAQQQVAAVEALADRWAGVLAPWVLKLCAEHFTQYGRQMPSRKRISPGQPNGGAA